MAQLCSNCREPTEHLTMGLCPSCCKKHHREGDIPYNAICIHCSEQRRPCLKWIKVGKERTVVCHNCAALIKRLRPRPRILGEMLTRLKREIWPEDWREAYRAGVIVHATPPPELLAPMNLGRTSGLMELGRCIPERPEGTRGPELEE